MQVNYYFEKSSGLLIKDDFKALRKDSKPDRRFSFYHETLTSTRILTVVNSEVLLDNYEQLEVNNGLLPFSFVMLVYTIIAVSISSIAIFLIVKKLRK